MRSENWCNTGRGKIVNFVGGGEVWTDIMTPGDN